MFKKLFGRKEETNSSSAVDVVDATNVSLADLDVGFLLDYDLKTYEVKSKKTNYEAGEQVTEWQLEAPDGDKIYLEKYVDDEVEWSVSRKISTDFLDRRDFESFNEDNPTPKIEYKNESFSLDEEGAATYDDEDYLYWTYISEENKNKSITVEQWDDNDFEASVGHVVSEHEFTNILPRYNKE